MSINFTVSETSERVLENWMHLCTLTGCIRKKELCQNREFESSGGARKGRNHSGDLLPGLFSSGLALFSLVTRTPKSSHSYRPYLINLQVGRTEDPEWTDEREL